MSVNTLISLKEAVESIEPAAAELFESDPAVRSVGVQQIGEGFGFRAVRNSQVIVPQSLGAPRPTSFKGIPVRFTETPNEVESLLKVPHSGPASPSGASVIPEVSRHRPAVCGLQIQNFDDDLRQGVIDKGLMTIGTLGCFVRLANGATAILSNNHVLAGENRGQRGGDRILQPGSGTFSPSDQVALLTEFIALLTSPAGAKPMLGNVDFNDVDAAVAKIVNTLSFNQAYLPFRNLTPPAGTAVGQIGDRVFKVGRTTGLTHGEIKDVATIVGPIAYDPGPCWFRRSLTIEGVNGTQFSDKGDSGSSIVLESTHEVVGLLYAGNGTQTYACPIDAVLSALN